MMAFTIFKIFIFLFTISAWGCVISIFLKERMGMILRKVSYFGLGFSAIVLLPIISLTWCLGW